MTDDRPAHLLSNRAPLREEAKTDLEEKLLPLTERRDEIVARLPKVVVNDNASAGNAADFITSCRVLLEDVDTARRDVKRPYDDAITVIQGRAQRFAEPVEETIEAVETRVRIFRSEARERAAAAQRAQRAEEARLRAEADARERGRLAVDPPAPVPVVEPDEISLPVARGDYGSKVRDKREKVYTITDVRQLPDDILNAPKVRDAMLAAIKQLGRLREEIPGVEIGWSTGEAYRKGG